MVNAAFYFDERRVRELWAIVGRGGGKSRTAAEIAVHTALLQSHRLAPGEKGYVLVIAQTTAQARVVFDYCWGFIKASRLLKAKVVNVRPGEIELHNGVVIAIHPASYRSVRGRTILACIFDEVAFWRDELSASPDVEVLRAVLPSLIRTSGQLIGISTPYRKSGVLYQRWKTYYGKDDEGVLVVQGDSRRFNPTLSEADIIKAMAEDPEAGASEWAAEFRADSANFLSDDDIDACIDFDRPSELPPRSHFTYAAFVDPSGGRHDAFAISIAHMEEDQRVVIDVCRGRNPPFDPQSTVDEFAALLKQYRCNFLVGDNYSAEWVVSAFKAAGIRYERSTMSKSQLYVEGLPSFTRRLLSLPNHPKLLRELRLLERRPHAGGKDTVDHGRTGSDDLANSVFGCLRQAAKPRQRLFYGMLAHGRNPAVQRDPVTDEIIATAAVNGPWVKVERPSRVDWSPSDEFGNKITPEEASLIHHGLHPRQLAAASKRRR